MADTEDPTVKVSDAEDRSRYEIEFEGELAGLAEYRLDGEVITFTHTEIDPDFGGRGLGSRLIEFAVTDARSRNLKIVPQCSFVRKWVSEHPESE
jgi:predicted GNAT family acetyltransferase